jgi:hypothetical protein
MTKLIVAFRYFASEPNKRKMKEKPIPIFSPRKEGYKDNGSNGKGKRIKLSFSAP